MTKVMIELSDTIDPEGKDQFNLDRLNGSIKNKEEHTD